MIPDDCCKVPECGKHRKAIGLCSMHYSRVTRHGSLDEPPQKTTEDRFWEKVDKSGGCWEWTAAERRAGYGAFHTPDGSVWAHRYAYELVHGTIPPGKFIDHTCHNRGCVNPGHLRPVTNKQNQENLAGAHRDSKSGVRGVHWDTSRRKWRATVGHNMKKYGAGYFNTIEEAEAAVSAKRRELFTHSDMDRARAVTERGGE